MDYIYSVEYLFIDDGILFISNGQLSNTIYPLISKHQNFVSYDYKTLWEVSASQIPQVYLHIEWPDLDLVTIVFNQDDLTVLKENKKAIKHLGILIHYRFLENEAENVIFITEIEGLDQLI